MEKSREINVNDENVKVIRCYWNDDTPDSEIETKLIELEIALGVMSLTKNPTKSGEGSVWREATVNDGGLKRSALILRKEYRKNGVMTGANRFSTY